MCGEHVLEVRRHGVRPEEVVIEGIVTVHSLRRVQNQKLIDQIQSVRVLHIRLQTLLHFPLLTFRKLHFLVQLIFLIDAWPHLKKKKKINNIPHYNLAYVSRYAQFLFLSRFGTFELNKICRSIKQFPDKCISGCLSLLYLFVHACFRSCNYLLCWSNVTKVRTNCFV